MPLVCGKSLNKEEIKDVQKDMMNNMKLGKSMLGTLQQSSLLQKVSAKKGFKIPQKVIEVPTQGGGTTCDVPENLLLVKEVKASKVGSSIFFLVTDFKLETKDESGEKQIVTAEEYGVIKCISLVPDGSKTFDLQKDVDKLKGVKDINSFMAKATEMQNLYGASTPQPSSVVVEKRDKNTSTVNLDDTPLQIVKVFVMKEGTNIFFGTRSYKLIGNVVQLYVPGEPDKEKVYKEVKVKYTVPGTSSVAKGANGNFDINQILAKVTKDKNFTTNDLKSLDSAKVKGLMGSHQADINNALQGADTSGPAGNILKQFQGASGAGGLDISKLDFGKTMSMASDLANKSAAGTSVEGAVKSLTSGDITGAFNKGLDLQKTGGSIPGLPASFDLTKAKNTDPTTALTGLLSITSMRPSTPNLTEIDRAGSRVSDKVPGPLIRSVTLSKTPVEIQVVEVRKPDTNFFFNERNFKKSGNKVTVSSEFAEIKVTYTYKGPEIKPGEAFSSRTLNTCTDIPKIKLKIPPLSKLDIANGVPISSKITKFNLAPPKTVPEAKPIERAPKEKTFTDTSGVPYNDIGSGYKVKRMHQDFLKKLGAINAAYWDPKIAANDIEYKRLKTLPEFKSLAKKCKEKKISARKLIEQGGASEAEANFFEKFRPAAINDKTLVANKYLASDVWQCTEVVAVAEEVVKLFIEVGEKDLSASVEPTSCRKDLENAKTDKLWVKYSSDEDKEHLERMKRLAAYQLAPEGIATENDRNVAIASVILSFEVNLRNSKAAGPIFEKIRALLPPVVFETKE